MDNVLGDRNASTVLFIGLGAMGYPMASRLASSGHSLRVRDVSSHAVDRFLDAHPSAQVASAEDVDVDTVILMLPNSSVVEEVLVGPDGLISSIRKGTLVIDMSSSEPMRTRALATSLDGAGIKFIDAPVSGGVRGAVSGELSIMVGGDGMDFAAARHLFAELGRQVYHVGPVGSGHAAKALNNLVSAATLAVTSEALHLGEKFGIDPSLLNSVLNSSTGRSNTSENKVEQFMLSGTYNSGFTLALMAKDLRIALGLAGELARTVPVSEATNDLWQRAAGATKPGTDHTALYEFLS